MSPPTLSATQGFLSEPRKDDPYQYQSGFGNRFASEAIPNTLPHGMNNPQITKYGLYAEQINGTGFVSSRERVQHVWLYRIRPAVAHQLFELADKPEDIESNFSPSNPRVLPSPKEICFLPLAIPEGDPVPFHLGIKTLTGSGEPGSDEGLSISLYACNAPMVNTAFSSMDGDMLIMPQQGALDITTELGRMRVRQGEICVIQRGIRFSVALPDGTARGYIQEVYGTHYELPELGPVGTNGMAFPRDFEVPVASFSLDESDWTCVYKMCSHYYAYTQRHTPFDVVAWHGNYAPYKYDLDRFMNIGALNKEQMDPSIATVLMARSRRADVSLTELMVFTPKWSVARDTFRIPYYHRNTYSEVYGMVKGAYGGDNPHMQPGALNFESSFVPHGPTFTSWERATYGELESEIVMKDTIGFMFHTSRMLTLTEYALKRHNTVERAADMYDDVKSNFMERIDEVEADLAKYKLPSLKAMIASAATNGANGTNGKAK